MKNEICKLELDPIDLFHAISRKETITTLFFPLQLMNDRKQMLVTNLKITIITVIRLEKSWMLYLKIRELFRENSAS